MDHNIELLRKQEKNSRKPSEDLTKYSQKALPCFARKNQKRKRLRDYALTFIVWFSIFAALFIIIIIYYANNNATVHSSACP